MKKLISMTDFVLETLNPLNFGSIEVKSIINYAKFLKQPLKKGMFVPCDDDDNILKKPNKYTSNLQINDEYEKAKEKVLFEGFEWNSNECMETIEDLIPYNLELTKNFNP